MRSTRWTLALAALLTLLCVAAKRKNKGTESGPLTVNELAYLMDKGEMVAFKRRIEHSTPSKINAAEDPRDGRSILHVACIFANSEAKAVKMLLDNGADPNVFDFNGMTPLHVCASMGNLQAVRMLLSAGAKPEGEPEVASEDVCTPLFETLRMFSKYTNLLHRQPAPRGLDPDFAGVVSALAAAGVSKAARCEGATALNMAVQYRFLAAVKTLIAHGFDVNAKANKSDYVSAGGTPLHSVAQMQPHFVHVSKILVRHPNAGHIPEPGSEVKGVLLFDSLKAMGLCSRADEIEQVVWTHGSTRASPRKLRSLMERWNAEFVEALLKGGASVTAVDVNGDTPLHLAAYDGNTQTVDLLRLANASSTARNKADQTPADMAAVQKRFVTLAALKNVSLSAVSDEEEPLGPQHDVVQHTAKLLGVDPTWLATVHWGYRSMSPRRAVIQPPPTNVKLSPLTATSWGKGDRDDLDIDYCDVQRVDATNLTVETFLRDFWTPQIPVILTNVTHDWPAFHKWKPGPMLKKYGDVEFPVFSAKSRTTKDAEAGKATYMWPLRKYIDYVKKQGGVDDEPLFLVDYQLDADPQRAVLLKDTRPVPWTKKFDQERAVNQFMLAPPLCGVPNHVHRTAANTLVFGRKRWFLWPPETAFISMRNEYTWYKEDYPTLSRLERPMECVQNAGEFFYVPDGWGHGTIYLSATVGMAYLYHL